MSLCLGRLTLWRWSQGGLLVAAAVGLCTSQRAFPTVCPMTSCVPLLGCHAATSKGLTRSCVIPGSNYRLDAHLLEDRDRVPRTLLISE